MLLWQYYLFGLRMGVHHLLLSFLVAAFLLRWAARGGRLPHVAGGLRAPAAFLAAIGVCSALTYVALASEPRREALLLFAKGLADLGLGLAGSFAVLCHLSGRPFRLSRRMLRWYAAGAMASSLYSVAEVCCAYHGFDLGKAFFGTISRYPPRFDLSAPFYYEWDVFFRAVGFAGVNPEGVYTAGAVVLLAVARPFDRARVNWIGASLCLYGLYLTFSRTGFLFLAVAAAVCLALRPRAALRDLPRILALATPILATYLLFPRGTAAMISTRAPHLSSPGAADGAGRPPPATALARAGAEPSPGGVFARAERAFRRLEAGRIEIYRPVWNDILRRPWGHGLNQFSLAIRNEGEIDLSEVRRLYPQWSDEVLREKYANIHNSWLTMLFDGGWPLLFAYLGFYLTAARMAWRLGTRLGVGATAIAIALMVSGLESNTLYLFFNQLLVILVMAAAVREKSCASN